MCLTISQLSSHATAAVVLHVAGELDLARVPDLRAQLASVAESPGPIVVDLSGVSFMGCSGLRPLLEAHHRFGDRLWLRSLPPAVLLLLGLTGLATTFRILDGPATP